MVTWPTSYVLTVGLIARGSGIAESVAGVIEAVESKIAARAGSKRGSSTVPSDCSSPSLTIAGATQAYGLSAGGASREIIDPAALRTGPASRVNAMFGILSCCV